MIKMIKMKQDDWIDGRAACALLGLKPQTLYAYVSRGFLRACADAADPRRSLYAREDLERLSARRRRPRARAEIAAAAIRWGDPVLDTAISGLQEGELRFGRLSAAACVRVMTLEAVAAHHFRVASFEAPQPPCPAISAEGTPLGRALGLLAREAAAPAEPCGREALAREGALEREAHEPR